MDFNFEKIAPMLSGKERAKLLIAEMRLQMKGRKAFTETEKDALLTITYAKTDAECWYCIELFRWGNFMWRKEIERIWQVLMLTFQSLAIVRDMPAEDNPFVMFSFPEMKSIFELHLAEFLDYEEVIKRVEEILESPLFDDELHKRYDEWFKTAKDFVHYWNIAVDEFNLDPSQKIALPTVQGERAEALVEEAEWFAKLTAWVLQERNISKK
jgi:hypothetical protein